MPTLQYQTPGKAAQRRPISWWFAPAFVIPAIGLSFVAFICTGHGPTRPLLVALTAPAILCTLPLQNVSELLVLSFMLFASVVQFSGYFAVLRARRSRPIWMLLSFHLTCCAAVWALMALVL